MRKIWRGIVNTIFWSYERGSWPYDVLVGVILIFLLLTPRRWFQDGPRPALPASSQVQLISDNTASSESIYRVDARLLPPDKRVARITPELERGTHDVLLRTVPSLVGLTFQVERIDLVRSTDGTLLDYDVTIRLTRP